MDVAHQLSNKVQHPSQQQPNTGQDLCQRLVQQAPKGVQPLFRMRHVLELAFCIVNTVGHIARQFLERHREAIFLRGGAPLTRGRLVLGLRRDTPVRVETSDGAVGFAENATSLLDQGTDFADEFFFIALVRVGCQCFIDFLGKG